MEICSTSDWYGFKKIDFRFEEKDATVIFANEPVQGNKWMLKTEYFGAFPEFEIEMLKRGYHLASVQNGTRWGDFADTERQAHFCDFLHSEFDFNEKCCPVGMSCGGMQAIYLAALYTEKVAAMFIDAPVVNLLSCPFGVGRDYDQGMALEYTEHTGRTISDMLSYRKHPLDYLPKIIDIPVFLACGDSDTVVPYEENGKLLYDYFIQNGGKIELAIKKGGNHHPHCLPDNTPIIKFITEIY